MTAAVFHANISQLVEALDLASRISILSPCGHETTKRQRGRVQWSKSKECFIKIIFEYGYSWSRDIDPTSNSDRVFKFIVLVL